MKSLLITSLVFTTALAAFAQEKPVFGQTKAQSQAIEQQQMKMVLRIQPSDKSSQSERLEAGKAKVTVGMKAVTASDKNSQVKMGSGTGGWDPEVKAFEVLKNNVNAFIRTYTFGECEADKLAEKLQLVVGKQENLVDVDLDAISSEQLRCLNAAIALLSN